MFCDSCNQKNRQKQFIEANNSTVYVNSMHPSKNSHAHLDVI